MKLATKPPPQQLKSDMDLAFLLPLLPPIKTGIKVACGNCIKQYETEGTEEKYALYVYFRHFKSRWNFFGLFLGWLVPCPQCDEQLHVMPKEQQLLKAEDIVSEVLKKWVRMLLVPILGPTKEIKKRTIYYEIESDDDR